MQLYKVVALIPRRKKNDVRHRGIGREEGYKPLLKSSVTKSSPPLNEEFPKNNLPLWISILNLVVAVATLVVLAWLYLRISESQIDDNIINATDSILTLLEKAKTLQPRERRLLVDWLNSWEYFNPPPFITRSKHPRPTKETIEKLRQYFNALAADDP